MGGLLKLKPTYRIKEWDEHFETAESRKLKGTRWVPMPTKHDGKGYRRITQHNEAVAIFCAWNLIVQVASKMPTRGVLADSDGPLDAADLSAKTGFPSTIFETALPFLSSDSIGWIALDHPRRIRQPARTRQNPPESADTAADSSLEGKGTEGNGKEGKREEAGVPPFSGKSFLAALAEFEQHRKEKRATLTPTARRNLFKKLEAMGEEAATAALIHSTAQGWIGVFPERMNSGSTRETASERNVRNIKDSLEYLNGLSNQDREANSEIPSRLLSSRS